MGSAPPEQAGAATGISETSGELGGAVGIAILGSLGTAVYRSRVAGLAAGGDHRQMSPMRRETRWVGRSPSRRHCRPAVRHAVVAIAADGLRRRASPRSRGLGYRLLILTAIIAAAALCETCLPATKPAPGEATDARACADDRLSVIAAVSPAGGARSIAHPVRPRQYGWPFEPEGWSRHSDLNQGPAVYETAALPLSYVGDRGGILATDPGRPRPYGMATGL